MTTDERRMTNQSGTEFDILDWDSNLFGYPVARINKAQTEEQLRRTLAVMRAKQVRLSYLFLNPNEIEINEAAMRSGAFLADEKITYVQNLPLQKWSFSTELQNIQSYTRKDLTPELLNLTLQSGEFSRFRVDKNFSRGEYEGLYTEWIKKSLSREIAADTLVYSGDEGIRGFITINAKNGIGSIGLIAVDPKFARQMIGQRLVYAGILKVQTMGPAKIQVVTQGANVVGCRFYEACGFHISKREKVYHFWL